MSDVQHYKAVLFDLDDTLYSYDQYITSGIAAVARYIDAVYGLTICDNTVTASCQDWEYMIEAICRKQLESMDTGLAYRVKHVFLTHIPQLQLLQDARCTLARLHNMQVMTGIFAPGPPHAQRIKVRALGVDALCNLVIYPDDVTGLNRTEDAIALSGMLMDIPMHHVIIAGNMRITDFHAIQNSPATILATKGLIDNPNSRFLLQQNRITSINSLLDIPDLIEEGMPLPQNTPNNANES
jgi:phosphoglycolate phosphatase-like HAD superfamily hydrolase